MRKQIAAIVIASLLAVMAPIAASAQTGKYYNSKRTEYRGKVRKERRDERARYSESDRYYDDRYYNDGYYGDYDDPNFYDRHRKAVNLAVGTGAGAAIGALIGGKKGALIGAAAGLAGGAIFTAKQKPRNYPKRY